MKFYWFIFSISIFKLKHFIMIFFFFPFLFSFCHYHHWHLSTPLLISSNATYLLLLTFTHRRRISTAGPRIICNFICNSQCFSIHYSFVHSTRRYCRRRRCRHAYVMDQPVTQTGSAAGWVCRWHFRVANWVSYPVAAVKWRKRIELFVCNVHLSWVNVTVLPFPLDSFSL